MFHVVEFAVFVISYLDTTSYNIRKSVKMSLNFAWGILYQCFLTLISDTLTALQART